MGLKLEKMEIEYFRSFRNVSFNVGRKITAISGQNGVGKSNVISLIASGSGLSKKGMLGSNFQPEFADFFNVDSSEDFASYKLYLTYKVEGKEEKVTKRLSFKNDTKTNRGIRIIPRTTNKNSDEIGLKQAEKNAKEHFGVGGSARIPIPTIYLSISRLYPLGEKKETVTIKEIKKNDRLYQEAADAKFREWYNRVIPYSIKNDASLSLIKKEASSRSSLHMDMERTPTLSQSVGQDNVGNIISALVDIYLLSKQEGYGGAILCIDEIEVSLHPDTQIQLLDLFYELSGQLDIQFVVSTHSLTILKEMLRKQSRGPEDYSVVYLKNPSVPMTTKHKSYEILKADLLGKTFFDFTKTKIYFEDTIGQHVFHLLIASLKHQCRTLQEEKHLRGYNGGSKHNDIEKELLGLNKLVNDCSNLQEIVMHLGCETLITLSERDKTYFDRVIFLIDGDARYNSPSDQPKVREYLGKIYDPKGKNDRKHGCNICLLPDHFAPESYLYRIIYQLVNNEEEHSLFWRTLDNKEETTLYTATKIRNKFSKLPTDFNNDDLKSIFGNYNSEGEKSEIWQFIDKTNMLDYYYCDYNTVEELIDFCSKFNKAYDIAYARTLENRFG